MSAGRRLPVAVCATRPSESTVRIAGMDATGSRVAAGVRERSTPSVVARFSYRATTNPAGARFLLFASKDEGETWTSFPLATPTGANVTTTQSIDITSLGFATPSDATKLRLRFTIVPAPSGTLTTRIDLVHIDVN